jgi:glycosyltransferase involved in cell wall biosynthesis
MESVKADVVHLHGMWLPEYKTAFKVAKRSNLPVVISPHGTLTPWDLSKKKWKKRLAMLLYQKAILAKVDMFFATSQVEADGLRLLGLKQPIAVVPIGVDIPVGINSTIEQESDGRVVLYMGRIHPGKGVLDLVEAWRLNRRPTWKLRIAGPAISSIELSYRRLVEKKIDEYGLASEIELLGMLDGSAKRNAFEAADIFILPTYSENFGIVVAEALAHGLPVITTTGAPWNELVEYNCGWWTSPGAVGISKALSSAMAMTPDELSEMGRRGRKLIIDNYSWRHIGASSLEAYKWLLDKSRPKPSFIID